MAFVIQREREIKGEAGKRIASLFDEGLSRLSASGYWEPKHYWDGRQFVTANKECKGWKTKRGAESALVSLIKTGKAFSDECSVVEI